MNSFDLTLPNGYAIVHLARSKVMGSVDGAVVLAIGFAQLYANPFSNSERYPFSNSERCRSNETNNASSLRNSGNGN